MNFGMIKLSGNTTKNQNYVIQIKIARDAKKRFDTLNYKLERSLLKGQKQKSYWLTVR